GERLYRQAREPKMRLWVEGADHNNLVQVAAEEYWQGLERFTRLIGGNGSPSPLLQNLLDKIKTDCYG
ncbi:MAG: hypothetical protein AAB299_00185, partial [Thermodesulfobacteriota bacterium]